MSLGHKHQKSHVKQEAQRTQHGSVKNHPGSLGKSVHSQDSQGADQVRGQEDADQFRLLPAVALWSQILLLGMFEWLRMARMAMTCGTVEPKSERLNEQSLSRFHLPKNTELHPRWSFYRGLQSPI